MKRIFNMYGRSGGSRGCGFALLVLGMAVTQAQALTDSFETYTNGATFEVATNGWQATTNLVQVQTNVVAAGEGTNAVILPQVSTFTNSVSPDISDIRSVVWTDYKIRPALGLPPSVGDMTNSSDSVRLYFDIGGYVAVESNRNNWVICSSNGLGSPVSTQISNQWVRISVCVDYARSNAAVFADGELLISSIPLPGVVATNYNRVFWDVQVSTSYLDAVSITNVWPDFATNSITDLDNDGMLDAQELQVNGNLTTYHRPNIYLVATNLTLGGTGGGTTVPAADFTVMPNSSTSLTFNANTGYHVFDVLTNGGSVGAALVNRFAGQATYNYTAIATDTTVMVQFKTNPVFHVVSTNLTLGVPGGGTVAPTTNADFAVLPYTGTNFTIDANAGYHVYDVLTNGGSVGAAALFGQYTAHATYTNSSITADTTVTVQFRTNFVVTSLAGTGGSITPSGTMVVYPGTNLVFAITSSPAYVVATLTTNTTQYAISPEQKVISCTLSNIQTNISMAVTFSYTSNRTVGAAGDYADIGPAVAAARAGDTIQVADGSYALTAPVVITNGMTLLGNTNSPASVRVVAPNSGADLDCFQVRTNGVVIEGFLMTGATNGTGGAGSGYLNAGIMVGNDASSNQMAAVRVLTNLGNGLFLFNQFSNCTHGVYVMAATNCTVAQSEFLGNITGVWASVSTEARSNWWGAVSGPGPVGPGSGDKVSLNVVTMPWWETAARAARVIYTNAPGLQATLDLAGAGDVIWTTNGAYAGDIVIDRAVRFMTGFSLDGKITFNHSVTLTETYSCTNALVASGAVVSLATSGSLATTNLVIQGSGQVVGSGGTAWLSADGFVMNGNFIANQTWASLVPTTLDFSDNFESYTLGMLLQAAGLRGWNATMDSVLIQTNYAATPGTNAVILPPETEVNNTVSTLEKRIWTDCRWLPILGDLATNAASSNQSIRISFDTNGWLAVDTTNGWLVCSNNAKARKAPCASNEWVRVSVFQDYDAGQQAVFLNGILLRQQLAFVGANASIYEKLRYLNTGTISNLYVDAVSIGTNLPPDMTGDINSNSISDALEIHLSGSLYVVMHGSIFKIR
jgi:hypothetical protein